MVALTTQPGFYLLQVNNRNTKNTKTRFEMCLKLTVSYQNDLNDIVLMSLQLTFNRFCKFIWSFHW